MYSLANIANLAIMTGWVPPKIRSSTHMMQVVNSYGQKDLSHALMHVAVQRQGLLSGNVQTAGSEVMT